MKNLVLRLVTFSAIAVAFGGAASAQADGLRFNIGYSSGPAVVQFHDGGYRDGDHRDWNRDRERREACERREERCERERREAWRHHHDW